jgi:hypothetical protein
LKFTMPQKHVAALQAPHVGAAVHFRGIPAGLQDLQVVHGRGDEVLPALIAQELGGLAGAAGEHGQRHLVFRHALAEGGLAGLHHGDGDLAGLAHDFDFRGRLDEPHVADEARDVGKARPADMLLQEIEDQGRHLEPLPAEGGGGPMLVQGPAEHGVPAVRARILPGPDILDPGHVADHLGLHERRDHRRRTVARDQ